MKTYTQEQKRREHLRRIAAKRVSQENQAQAICELDGSLKIFAVDDVPREWLIIDVIHQDSPELGFLMYGRSRSVFL